MEPECNFSDGLQSVGGARKKRLRKGDIKARIAPFKRVSAVREKKPKLKIGAILRALEATLAAIANKPSTKRKVIQEANRPVRVITTTFDSGIDPRAQIPPFTQEALKEAAAAALPPITTADRVKVRDLLRILTPTDVRGLAKSIAREISPDLPTNAITDMLSRAVSPVIDSIARQFKDINLVGLTAAEIEQLRVRLRQNIVESGVKLGAGDMESSEVALSDGEIHKIMKHITPRKHVFLGVPMRDEIIHLKPHKRKDSSFIFNTDTSDGPGEHWRACYLSPQAKTLEYYDSFGEEPPSDIAFSLCKLCRDISDEPVQIKINRVKNQHANSHTCGYHCINFIQNRMAGRTFRDTTEFDSKEAQTKKMQKKYREFIKV